MDSKNLLQHGNTLQVTLDVTFCKTPIETVVSPEYIINGSAIFQVKAFCVFHRDRSYGIGYNNTNNSTTYNNMLFVRFVKLREGDDLTYTLKFNSKALGITNKSFFTNDDTWHLIYESKDPEYSFDVTVKIDIVPSIGPFVSLYEDTELSDFELKGEDGSVHTHRAVLAASSPVLSRMLSGTWRESKEGRVDVPGTSKMTLQHLKDYIYLHTLPETGLEQLLLTASYYMMPVLEQKCVDKLVNTMTVKTAFELLEFATKHKVERLVLAILECVQSGAVKVNDMRDHCLRGKGGSRLNAWHEQRVAAPMRQRRTSSRLRGGRCQTSRQF